MADTVGTGPWPGLQRTGSENLFDTQQLASQEKGLWTPVIVGRASAGVATNPLPVGRWYRTGNHVRVVGKVGWDSHTGTGELQISNLPFQSESFTADTSVQWYGIARHSRTGGVSEIISYIRCNRFGSPTYIRFIFPSYVASVNDIAAYTSQLINFDISYYTDFSTP